MTACLETQMHLEGLLAAEIKALSWYFFFVEKGPAAEAMDAPQP
jgi:hypothetical protein